MDKVDKFLLDNKIVVEDEGFTQRVMETLPERVDWQRRLLRIWNCVFFVMLAMFCWKTEVFEKLYVDVKAFLLTLPVNIHDVSIWQTMGVFYLTIMILTFLILKKYEKVF